MRSVKKLGHVSLAIAAGGFVGLESAIHLGWLGHPLWRVLAGGFEAGTVGALADWYAVTALFRRVPIPILGRHSNIIVNNRQRIIANLADTVEHEWLTPEVIGQHLQQFSIVEGVLDYLDEPTSRAQVQDFLRDALGKVAEQIDRPELAEFLQALLREQLGNLDLARPLGEWLQRWMAEGEHRPVWDALLAGAEAHLRSEALRQVLRSMLKQAVQTYVPTLLNQTARPELVPFIERVIRERLAAWDVGPSVGPSLRRAVASGSHAELLTLLIANVRTSLLTDPAIRQRVRETLEGTLRRYRQEHFVRGVVADLLVERNAAVDSFIAALAGTLEKIEQDPGHEIRQRLDAMLLEFADRLTSRDPDLSAAVEKFKRQVAEQADWPRMISRGLEWVRRTVRAELESDTPGVRLVDYDALTDVVTNALSAVIGDVRRDPAHPLRARLDEALSGFAARLAGGDAELSATVERFKRSVIDHPSLREILQAVLRSTRSTLASQLATADSALARLISHFMGQLVDGLRADPSARQRLDAWIRGTVQDLVTRHHSMVGQMVRSSLEKLSPEEMVANIEQKIGDDLQFIRLNGAVVGFMVGIVLATLRQFVF
jgi:uncharacterized membrane-anchored protein YjiN (DUF445 family)